MNPLHLKLTYITNTEQVYLIVSRGKASCNYVAHFNFFHLMFSGEGSLQNLKKTKRERATLVQLR